MFDADRTGTQQQSEWSVVRKTQRNLKTENVVVFNSFLLSLLFVSLSLSLRQMHAAFLWFFQIRTVMTSTNPKLGFIGAGMMSSAMINGIIAAKVRCERLVCMRVYTNRQTKRTWLGLAFGWHRPGLGGRFSHHRRLCGGCSQSTTIVVGLLRESGTCARRPSALKLE